YVYQAGVLSQYSLAVRGGSQNSAWIASGGYDKNIGNLNEIFERTGLRIDHTLQPTKKLSINPALFYVRSNSVSGRSVDLNTANGSLPAYSQLADASGKSL